MSKQAATRSKSVLKDTRPVSPVPSCASDVDYQVEKVLDKRIRHGKVEYYLKWLGYSE